MRNKRGILALIVLLSLLALACNAIGRGSDPTPEPTQVEPTTAPTDIPEPTATSVPTDAPDPTATSEPTTVPEDPTSGGATIEIINQSGQEIAHIYISLTNADEWGDDQLEGDTIPDGGSYTITDIPEGTYDLLAEDASESEIATLWEADVTGDNTWTVTVSEGSLEVNNQSEDTIVELYISPSTNDSWGDDWLAGGTIESGDTFMVEGLAEAAYDVQALDADGDVIEMLYNYYIDGEYYWNVTGRADLPTNAVLRFEEDFSDNRNNWAQTPESDDVHYMTPENGEYCIEIKATDLTAWEWYEPFRPDEFVAEVACMPDEDTDASCGLGFGPDGDNLFWFEVSPWDQTFALFVLEDDQWQDALIDWTPSYNIIPNGWNYLSLERVDGIVSVFINGVLNGQVESDLFPTGRIGIGGSTYDDGNVTVCLDDLSVWRME